MTNACDTRLGQENKSRGRHIRIYNKRGTINKV